MKNNIDYKKMWVVFVNIIAEKGYKFDDLVDNEGRANLQEGYGAVAYIVVQSENIRTAIEIVHKGLAEKHFYAIEFYRIDNLDSLLQNNAARKIDIRTARRLEKSQYVFEISGRIWTYFKFSESLESNLWIVRAKDSNFEYLKNGKKGQIKISDKWIYAIVKCDKIDQCPYLFARGSKDDNLSIKFIDSIINFNEYLDNNDPISENVFWKAEELRRSDKNFIYISLFD